MKPAEVLLIGVGLVTAGVIATDLLYTSRFESNFKELEKQRIITSNQLATAKIVSENLNHVRDLVFRNMDFPGQKDSVSQESILFEFLTTCVNDLKMRLISVRPSRPTVSGRVTTYGYDIQLEGDFFSFGEFCSKLENSQRVLALTSFQVNQALPEKSASAPDSKGDKGQSTPASKSILIKMHLDTFRVKKAT